jgi:hypothetical protein
MLPSENRQYPSIVPIIGAVSCFGLIAFLTINSWIIGIIGLAIGIVWYGVQRRMRNKGGDVKRAGVQ